MRRGVAVFCMTLSRISRKSTIFQQTFLLPKLPRGLASMLIGDPGFYGVVAEEAGTIVGSNFMDERSSIFGIGPISVAPEVQNKAVGR